MIDGALRTMIDEVLILSAGLFRSAVEPERIKRHLKRARHSGTAQSAGPESRNIFGVFLDSEFARYARAPE